MSTFSGERKTESRRTVRADSAEMRKALGERDPSAMKADRKKFLSTWVDPRKKNLSSQCFLKRFGHDGFIFYIGEYSLFLLGGKTSWQYLPWTSWSPCARAAASSSQAPKSTAAWPTLGTTVLWALSSRTTSRRPGGRSSCRKAPTTPVWIARS